MDEVEHKLGLAAIVLAGLKFTQGSNLDIYSYEVSQTGHMLTFTHGPLSLHLHGWKLVDRKAALHCGQAVDESIGIRYWYYSANVEWKYGKHKGSAKAVILDSSEDRGRVTMPHIDNAQAEAYDILQQTGKALRDLFHTELFEPEKAVKRYYSEDMRSRIKEF